MIGCCNFELRESDGVGFQCLGQIEKSTECVGELHLLRRLAWLMSGIASVRGGNQGEARLILIAAL